MTAERTPADWVSTHPRQAMQLLVILLVALWQLPMACLGVVLFLLLFRLLRLRWLVVDFRGRPYYRWNHVAYGGRPTGFCGESSGFFTTDAQQADVALVKLVFEEGV